MLNGKKTRLFFLVIASLCASAAAADTAIVQYVTSGPNGGFPFETLKVYQSGKAELINDNFSTSTTKTYSLTQVELNDLIKLFTDNSFSTLDSTYWSGCLACPVWAMTYGSKTVRGNTTGGIIRLANIKAGLDALVNKIKSASPVVFSKASLTRSGINVSSSIRVRLNLNGTAGRSGIVIERKGFSGAYTISGQRTILAH